MILYVTLIAFKISNQQLDALDRAAQDAHNTRSCILRLAIDKYLGTDTATVPQRAPLSPKARTDIKHSPTCTCTRCRK